MHGSVTARSLTEDTQCGALVYSIEHPMQLNAYIISTAVSVKSD